MTIGGGGAMGRRVMLSNGSMMVGLNQYGLVHDFYFPYVGQENLANARGLQHLVGIWVDGQFSWLDDSSWETTVDFETTALVSNISAVNQRLKVKLQFTDFVDFEQTAFCRRINLTNLDEKQRKIRIFLHQAFQISEGGRADTALFVPHGHYLYDYKGRCALLISAQDSKHQPFEQFSIGNFGIEDKEGTFKDAEDGTLDGNLVEHGTVDSVIGCNLSLEAGGTDQVDYWIVASSSQLEAESIHRTILDHGLHSRLDATRNFWRSWLAVADNEMNGIGDEHKNLFRKSLMLIKAHIDKHGGIIASGDSSIYNYGRDYYSYVWPRDGALTMLTLIRLGYQDEPKRFLEFCIDTINPKGYMMHKYQVDRSIGSTWHPLMHRHHPELAIQEDETALVIIALSEYLEKFPNQQFMETSYDKLVRPASNFMARFIDESTGLPHASYDLWEEKFGTHTFTTVVTKKGLEAAASIADKLNHSDTAEVWRQSANRIGTALPQLYNEQLHSYRKSQFLNGEGDIEREDTIDSSSLYGFVEFYPDQLETAEVAATADTVQRKLLNTCPAGGVIRYENDSYFLEHKEYLGNPWIICSLWLARYFVKAGNNSAAQELLDWALQTAAPSGVLAEQVDPIDRHQVGVSPLVWSHAELINTLLDFYKD